MAKGPAAFRTISEAADEVGVPQHVLRFWETKFAFIRPMKRAGGRRFYRPTDIELLKGVRALLHDKGYTIKGVQRVHREEGVARLTGAGGGAPEPAAAAASARTASESSSRESGTPTSPGLMRTMLDDLEQAKAALDAALGKG